MKSGQMRELPTDGEGLSALLLSLNTMRQLAEKGVLDDRDLGKIIHDAIANLKAHQRAAGPHTRGTISHSIEILESIHKNMRPMPTRAHMSG